MPADSTRPAKAERMTLSVLQARQRSRLAGGGVTKPSTSNAKVPSSKKLRPRTANAAEASTTSEPTSKRRFDKGLRPKARLGKAAIALPTASDASATPVPPWIVRASTKRTIQSQGGLTSLDAELADFARYSRATAGETARRDAIVAHVRSVATSLWSDARVDVFGSVSTGLCAPDSDIDMAVITGSVGKWSLVRALHQLRWALQRRGDGTPFRLTPGQAKVVGQALVPLVKARFAECTTSIDITFNTTSGAATCDTVRSYLQRYGDDVTPIFYVAKEVLIRAGLNDVAYSGLGSYTLFNMAVYHVQQYRTNFPDTVRTCDDKVRGGMLLRDFFTLWAGDKLNVATTGVCIADGGYTYNRFARFGKHVKNFTTGIKFDDAHDKATRTTAATTIPANKQRSRRGLGVQDVDTSDNELGWNCGKIISVQRLFQACAAELTEWIDSDANERGSGPKHPTALSTIVAVTDRMKRRRDDVLRSEAQHAPCDVLQPEADLEGDVETVVIDGPPATKAKKGRKKKKNGKATQPMETIVID